MRVHEGPGAPPPEQAGPITLGRTPGPSGGRTVFWDPPRHGNLLVRGPRLSGKTTVARTILAHGLKRGWGVLLLDGAFERHTNARARLYGGLARFWTTGRVVSGGKYAASGLEGLMGEIRARERELLVISGTERPWMPLLFVLEDPAGVPRDVDSGPREPGYARWCLQEIAGSGPAVGVHMVVCARPWELRSHQNVPLRSTLRSRLELAGAEEPGRGVYRAQGLPATELRAHKSVPSTLDRIWRRIGKERWAQESAEGVLW